MFVAMPETDFGRKARREHKEATGGEAGAPDGLVFVFFAISAAKNQPNAEDAEIAEFGFQAASGKASHANGLNSPLPDSVVRPLCLRVFVVQRIGRLNEKGSQGSLTTETQRHGGQFLGTRFLRLIPRECPGV